MRNNVKILSSTFWIVSNICLGILFDGLLFFFAFQLIGFGDGGCDFYGMLLGPIPLMWVIVNVLAIFCRFRHVFTMVCLMIALKNAFVIAGLLGIHGRCGLLRVITFTMSNPLLCYASIMTYIITHAWLVVFLYCFIKIKTLKKISNDS